MQTGDAVTDQDDLQAIRERLPVMRTWQYTHNDHVTDITVGYHAWPHVIVILGAWSGSQVVAKGVFAEDGRLWQLTHEAPEGAEISTVDLRRPALIHSLKRWEVVGREIGRQILSGAPEQENVADALSATEALRILASSSSRQRTSRTRGGKREDLLRQVASEYRKAVAAGDLNPRITLAARFGYSPAHIGRVLMAARKPRDGQPPLLGPAKLGRAGEQAPQSPPSPAASRSSA